MIFLKVQFFYVPNYKIIFKKSHFLVSIIITITIEEQPIKQYWLRKEYKLDLGINNGEGLGISFSSLK